MKHLGALRANLLGHCCDTGNLEANLCAESSHKQQNDKQQMILFSVQ